MAKRRQLVVWIVASSLHVGCEDEAARSEQPSGGKREAVARPTAAAPTPVASVSSRPAPRQLGPVRYPPDRVKSPITESVARRLRAIAGANAQRAPNVFMKVGDSGTVTGAFLNCFANPDAGANPGWAARPAIRRTVEFFGSRNAKGSASFDRRTLAARVGRTAKWVLEGNPSPLDLEIAAINPRFAFVSYGTNDMGYGETVESALFNFYESFSALLDKLEAAGVVPIVTGLNPRRDGREAVWWVPTYNAATRAISEKRQIPFIDSYLAMNELPDHGLVYDGVHGNSFRGPGGTCVFSADALRFNYNVRNLLSVEVLDVVKRVTLDGEAAPDKGRVGDGGVRGEHRGQGSAAAPFEVDRVPFSHSGDTRLGSSEIDAYPSCSTKKDESGPELFYRLKVAKAMRIRAFVLSRRGVDVDLHLLRGEPTGLACIDRDDRLISRRLEPGTYFFSVDTFSGKGEVFAGEYSFVVVECEPGDPDCR